jgi:hypothetical protein
MSCSHDPFTSCLLPVSKLFINFIHLYFVDAELRPDAILLFGVSEMSTKDVFNYFQDYTPDSIEWIDDISCMSTLSCFLLKLESNE